MYRRMELDDQSISYIEKIMCTCVESKMFERILWQSDKYKLNIAHISVNSFFFSFIDISFFD